MEKYKKYKIVFNAANDYLNELISQYPEINSKAIKKHLASEEKFENMKDAHCRMIKSLSNRNMMSKVIGFEKKENVMRCILFDYDPHDILASYDNPEALLGRFSKEFELNAYHGKKSLWRIFANGIISSSKFMSSFKGKEDFNKFIESFSLNKYTKAALPMLLSREIEGFGFALACDFLKEIGYRDYPKPDVHLIKIFYDLGLSDSQNQYDVYKSIIEMSELVGEDAYTVDKIFWLISSGRFYLLNIEIGRHREEFITYAKKRIAG